MRKSLIVILFVLTTALFNSAFASGGNEPLREADYVPGEILVRFREGVPAATSRAMIQSLGMKTLNVIDELRVERLKLPPGVTVKEIVTRYRQDPRVEFAEPNYIAWICTRRFPNDPRYLDRTQWSLDNPRDHDIDAPEAWFVTTGANRVIIAILDTGVDRFHEDLTGKIIAGFDFVGNDNDPQDEHGHGTHVAGIAAAMTNNAIGIAGVDWQARIMPVRVMHPEGFGSYHDIASGIIFAADNGARVINLSLGGPFPSRTLKDAVRHAYNKGVVIVAAAGNTGAEGVLYPAAFDQYVLGVAATDSTDTRAAFSTYGPEVDVAAPGVGIYSTYWVDGVLNSYGTFSGTSMSAPHVAGLASLLIARYPHLSNDEIMARIKHTAEDVNSATHPGEDIYLGYGRINAHLALTALPTPALEFLGYLIDDDNIPPSRGDNNRVAGPGEIIELTITLKNLWGEARNVSARLTTTAAGIIIIDGSALFRDIEPDDRTPYIIEGGHRADNSANHPFIFSVASHVPVGTRVSFTLHITADGGYTTTQHFSIIINNIQPSILIVDDDGGRLSHGMWGFEEYFKDALESKGFGYTVWDVSARGFSPRSEDLKPYDIVIWTTGDVYRPPVTAARPNPVWPFTFTTIERLSLMEYLESGGRLWLSSMDVLYDVFMDGKFADFATYYLKVDFIDHAADTLSVLDVELAKGFAGNPISRDMDLTFNYGAVGIENHSDWFIPAPEATKIFRDEHENICALKYAGHYALVFTPFAFEAIIEEAYPNNQRVLLNRIIRWLDGVVLGPDRQLPQVPQGLTVTDSVGGVSLGWQKNYEPDVVGYEIFRRHARPGEPFPAWLPLHHLATGGATFFRDTELYIARRPADRLIYQYRIRAVDEAGNESDFTTAVFAIPTPAPAVGGGGGGGGGCFIATAVYGTPMATEVRALADFRDRYLLASTWGRKLVAFYEHHSPLLAAYVSTRPALKAAVRGILRPIVWLLTQIENNDGEDVGP